MIRLIAIATIIIMTSCNSSTKEIAFEDLKQIDEINLAKRQDTSLSNYNDPGAAKPDSQSITIDTDNTTKKNKLPDIPLPARYIEFPGDNNFNGKPMTQQEDISKEILEKHPDTLSKLAIARYKSYDYLFPKSIADNFEEGISTTHIHYPKALIFRFELFENKTASTSYITKEITVRSNENGELYSE